MTQHIVCPTPVALSQAATERGRKEANSELTSHLAECAACAREWKALTQIDDLVRELPAAEVDDSRRQRLRAAIVSGSIKSRATASGRSRRTIWLATSFAAAASFALAAPSLYTRWQARTTAAYHAEIAPESGAIFARESAAPDEIVRLRSGTLRLKVSPLSAGERFRVLTGSSQVEVRGTSFEVVAEANELRAVRVEHGLVEVRDNAGTVARVGTGQSWRAPTAPPDPRAGAPAPLEPEQAHAASTPQLERAVEWKGPAAKPNGAKHVPVDAARNQRPVAEHALVEATLLRETPPPATPESTAPTNLHAEQPPAAAAPTNTVARQLPAQSPTPQAPPARVEAAQGKTTATRDHRLEEREERRERVRERRDLRGERRLR